MNYFFQSTITVHLNIYLYSFSTPNLGLAGLREGRGLPCFGHCVRLNYFSTFIFWVSPLFQVRPGAPSLYPVNNFEELSKGQLNAYPLLFKKKQKIINTFSSFFKLFVFILVKEMFDHCQRDLIFNLCLL